MIAGVDIKVIKALVQAARFNDYTHWRELDADFAGPQYELGLGYGYKLVATPISHRRERWPTFHIVYEGRYIYRNHIISVEFCNGRAKLIGIDNTVTLFFDEGFDAEEYAASIDKDDSNNIMSEKDVKSPHASIIDTHGVYWGVEGRTGKKGFDPELKNALMLSAILGDHSRLNILGKCSGPADIIVMKIVDKDGHQNVHMDVLDDGRIPISIHASGILKTGGEGIQIYGRGSVYTIPLNDDEKMGFYEKHRPIPLLEYLDAHPVKLFSDIVGKKEEHVRKIVDDL